MSSCYTSGPLLPSYLTANVQSSYGMQRETQGPEALLDFFRQEGVPLSIIHYNSKMQASYLWQEYCRRYWVKDRLIEPYHPNQNASERAMAVQKKS